MITTKQDNENFLLVVTLLEKGGAWYVDIVKCIGMTNAHRMALPSISSTNLGVPPIIHDFPPTSEVDYPSPTHFTIEPLVARSLNT